MSEPQDKTESSPNNEQLKPQEETQNSDQPEEEPLSPGALQYFKSIKLKFRNYEPHSQKLKQFYSPTQPTLLSEQTEKILQEEKKRVNVNILPVKMDMDLKRDVEDDLDQLDRETMKVMKTMVEERMTSSE